MRKRDLDKFREILQKQRAELVQNARAAVGSGAIHLDPDDFPDEMDTASSEVTVAFQGRLRERERGLLAKVEAALQKIEDGVYGECEECGEHIEVKRLRARPVAELCVDCKREQERRERNLS